LYVAETHENIRLLQRSLVELDASAPAGAVAEAFRAAHTLKGISAAMGYQGVADLAHHLEDRLDALRAGRVDADPGIVDALLAAADELEDAIAEAIRIGPSAAGAASSSVTGTGARPSALTPPPEGTARVAHVTLRADAPIKSARAALIVRAVAELTGVIGCEPAELEDDFGGFLRDFLGATAHAAAAEPALRPAREVAAGEALAPEPAAPAEAAAGVVDGRAQPGHVRQVRVDSQRLDGLADGLGELSVLYARLQRAEVPARAGEMIDRLGTVLGELEHEMRA